MSCHRLRELWYLRGLEEIEPIGDDTLIQRLAEAERRALRDAAPAYPELLEHPEVM